MTQTTTLRPGVFSQYTVSSLYSKRKSRKQAALLGEFPFSEPVWVESFGQAAALAGGGKMLSCLKLLLGAGVGRVLCLPLPTLHSAGELADALALLEGQDAYALVADVALPELEAIKPVVERLSANGQEMLLFAGAADSAEAVQTAQSLCSERVILACPAATPVGEQEPQAVYSACAVAGMVLGADDPTANFSGQLLEGVASLEARLSNEQVEALLLAGVTPLELVGGNVECIRALTTKTPAGGAPDRSFAPIGTILAIDDVMTSVRAMLRQRLGGLKNTPAAMTAVASQMIVLLEEKLEQGVITQYQPPTARPLADDPSICVVELGFRVAYAVNQIYIQAQITV